MESSKRCPEANLSPIEHAKHLLGDIGKGSDTVESLRTILREIVPNLGMAEISILEEFLVNATGHKLRTVSSFIKEAKDYVKDRGYIHDAESATAVYIAGMDETYPSVVSSGLSLYTYDDDTGAFEAQASEDVEKHLLDFFAGLPLLQKESSVRNILKRIRLHYANDAFFAHTKAGVNLKDGFLSLEGGLLELLAHSPDHRARMQLNASYDPEASFEWFEAGLSRILPSQTSLDALQEIIGAIVFNVEPAKDSVRRMFILYGAPRSGKSTIINILLALLPASCVGSVPPGHWSDPNYRAALENLVLNYVTELGGSTRIGSEHMKKIVSREPVIVRRMRRDPVTITPIAWHLFATNEMPRIVDKTDAFERRLLVVTFPRSLELSEIDETFHDKVRAAPSAVLRWAAIGATRLLETGTFTVPNGHSLAVAEMQFGDDLPLVFVHTQVRQVPGARVSTTELRDALKAFVRQRDVDPETIDHGTIRRVAAVLQTRFGATRRKTNGRPFYDGVSLVFTHEPEAEGPEDVELGNL